MFTTRHISQGINLFLLADKMGHKGMKYCLDNTENISKIMTKTLVKNRTLIQLLKQN